MSARRFLAAVALAGVLAPTARAFGQTLELPNPVLQRIWRIGMDSSMTYRLAQALTDSVGPRLTGSPGHKAGNDWLVNTYKSWGINARNEQYGTWLGWRRGYSHVDLMSPRVRSLEGLMLAWSPGTNNTDVRGDAVILTEANSPAEFQQWLNTVRGKFVMVSFPQPTCRPDNHWEQNALPETFEKLRRERSEAQRLWGARLDTARTGIPARDLHRRLEQAGAAGIISSNWSQGWGVEKIFAARTQRAPTVQLSCEDYGLVYRLAENGDKPSLRVNAHSEFLGEVPVFNTIAEIKGTQLPNEYVMLSAHFDSWDGSSGATDNGTGTITMLEALRIIKEVLPNPKRTIVVGHWGGEEQGLNGSRAFAADHPEIVQGLQALFNQDNGTGRVVSISMQGLSKAATSFVSWYAQLPKEISRHISLGISGSPGGGGSDYAAFICYGAPAFSLSATGFDYGTYTWHTNRDTFDKISFDDLKNNATLVASLVYLASEDPQRVSRDRVDLVSLAAGRAAGGGRGGASPAVVAGRGGGRGGPPSWPSCQQPQRNSTNYFR